MGCRQRHNCFRQPASVADGLLAQALPDGEVYVTENAKGQAARLAHTRRSAPGEAIDFTPDIDVNRAFLNARG